jgi:hypothetical protein
VPRATPGCDDSRWNPPWSQAQLLRGPKIRRITGKAAAARADSVQVFVLDEHGSASLAGRPFRAVILIRRQSPNLVRGIILAARSSTRQTGQLFAPPQRKSPKPRPAAALQPLDPP